MSVEGSKYTLRFIKPKMNDSGLYTVKVVSRQETVVETFNLTVGPYIDDGSGIIIGKAARYEFYPINSNSKLKTSLTNSLHYKVSGITFSKPSFVNRFRYVT